MFDDLPHFLTLNEQGDADANTQAATEHNDTPAPGTVQFTMQATSPRAGLHLSPLMAVVVVVVGAYLLFGEFD